MQDPEEIGAEIAADVSAAIEDAQTAQENAAALASDIAAAAMESERGNRIENLERRIEECQNVIADLSEAIPSLILGFSEVSAKVDLLTQLQSPMPNPPSVEVDGPPESQDPQEPVVVIETPEAEPEPPREPVPRKKRHSWI